MKRALFALIGIAILGMTSLPAAAQAEYDEAYEDEYSSGDFGRIRYQENGVTIIRAAGAEAAEAEDRASVNAPIFPGDTIRSASDQRAEIQLSGGTVVRVDRGSALTFQSLPDPYAEYVDNAVLKLAYGTIQISAVLSEGEEFRIDTPAASVYLLGDGDFRIEVDDRGRARVLSRRGVAEVVGDSGSVLVRGGMRTTVWAGSVPDDPQSFNTFVADSFDRWVEEREDVYRVRDRYIADDETVRYDDLPYEVRPYYSELSYYGRWVYEPTYGYCWYPYDVATGWRPYWDGYWSYGPHGYFWVSHEPWGWAPYHYGRWSWVSGYGWCWVPGRIFAGAWVSWSWGSAYVGWCPLDYWNRPAFIGSLYWDYYDLHSWTFIRYSHFHDRYYRRHAVPVGSIGGDLRRSAVVTRPPRVSPRDLATSPEARARAVRMARDNRKARVPKIVRDATPTRGFGDVEKRYVRKGRKASASDVPGRRPGLDQPADAARRARPGQQGDVRGLDRGSAGSGKGTRFGGGQAGTPGSRVQGTRERTAPSADRPIRTPRRETAGKRVSAGSGAGEADSRGREIPSRPPRISTGARGSRTSKGSAAKPGGESRGAPAQVRPRASGTQKTDERLKDMYRQIRKPRDSRSGEEGSKEGSSAGRSPSKPQKAEPRSTTPSRQRARPSQPSRSRPSTRKEPKKSTPSQQRERPAPRSNNSATRRVESRRTAPSRETSRPSQQRSSPAPTRVQPRRSSPSNPAPTRVQPRRSSPSNRTPTRVQPRRSSPSQPSRSPSRAAPSRRSAPSRSTPSRGGSGSSKTPSKSGKGGSKSGKKR